MKKKLLAIALFAMMMPMTVSAKTLPDGTEFNAKFYADTYSDLKAAYGYDEEALYQHYVTCGQAEGRICRPDNVTAPTAQPAQTNGVKIISTIEDLLSLPVDETYNTYWLPDGYEMTTDKTAMRAMGEYIMTHDDSSADHTIYDATRHVPVEAGYVVNGHIVPNFMWQGLMVGDSNWAKHCWHM